MPNKHTDSQKHFDSQGDITDADIKNYAPTPDAKIGKNALRWLAGTALGAVLAVVAVKGTESIITTLNNNPHDHGVGKSKVELTQPAGTRIGGDQGLAVVERHAGLYGGGTVKVNPATLRPQYRQALENVQPSIKSR